MLPYKNFPEIIATDVIGMVMGIDMVSVILSMLPSVKKGRSDLPEKVRPVGLLKTFRILVWGKGRPGSLFRGRFLPRQRP